MMRMIDPKTFRLELDALDCIDKFGYVILPITKLNIALERSTVDAVPVVRCKDCGYSYDDTGGLRCSYGVCVDCIVPEDFFCRYGERKGGADDA